ncbi:putative meiosis protein MEI2 [Aspergillus glaucus CBS 516.65]|uniref:RRM domain-containing protein n=1 Tax=Aspergillus glaucus CBS 516.65 TaxID=1160497 RepID=A0A1L9VLW7_ASPGL|nr:hypothetical protein ASPGLDRAFT_25554 [Aspergillus glaucus CBS 516.65]OJJ84919.1 hypothetical protein ASPGLDRAFT_25554 [Aspergillus glaucus CBS 516.65]
MRSNASSSRILSSPGSTNGPPSPHGSSDTKLTAFSPEDVRSKGRSDSSVNTPLNDAGFRRVYSLPSSDPFWGQSGPSNRVQLSPMAASFTPISMTGNIASQSQFESPLTRDFSNVGRLAANSDPEIHGPGAGIIRFSEPNVPEYGPVGNAHFARNNFTSSAPIEKLDSERRSRAFVIENVPTNLSYMALAGFFNRREFGTLKGPVLTELSSMGNVYLSFTDSRDAKNAFEKVHLLRPEWHIVPLTARELAQRSDPSLLPKTSDFEGQLLVAVYYDSRNPKLNQHSVSRSLEALVLTFGDIKKFSQLSNSQDNVSEFHLEFFNTRDAENASISLNGARVDDCVLEVSHFHPDLTNNNPYLPLPSPTTPVKDRSFHFEDPYPRRISLNHGRPTRTPCMELSPTGRSTVPQGEHADLMDWMSKTGENVLPSPRRELGRYSDSRPGNQNAVDVERIRLGLDVRTTIMLRNIPNKIDQGMLKSIIDETSYGKYDFMYLRIDFANNCNVGYAFINFEDPIDIIDFVNARAGRSWNCFNSDKVAEVSYATIQGKDCLIQKFRNSSVMLEHPSFRPKIFHAGTGPLAGTEDRFPGPDNPSKMRRSIENAEHIGLFAPRVSQQYRDEQRRRRSQFDRGTTAAEREIVYVRTIAPKHSSMENDAFRATPCTYPLGKLWYEDDTTIRARGPRTS